MTVADALSHSGLGALDAEVLLAAALGQSRSWLLAHPEGELGEEQIGRFTAYAARRASGEPVAYILGEREFYGRPFRVTPATLIPRPATELLVEQALRALDGERVERVREIDTGIVAWSEMDDDSSAVGTVVDVGTGGGCIAVTLACERPDIRVIATDISGEALAIARENAARHGVESRIEFRTGDGLRTVEDIAEPFLLVSNPPYIPAGNILERDVADFEPAHALFAGSEGTDVLRPLVESARAHPACVGFVIECRGEQAR